ncbi:hypothetical protein PY093_12545 [Cytobacillus sp. S13-E01]|uniref:hypothetical protein n=1 Tax=Cytobacillus sp. S13-E01 TaxID=3031326 RepID=UPI0023D879E1|nr:hypothetical protein [Cytobacillus sp. S13-E01]MDF0727518.1 hypothetical protein [Cytobacillus sp. S13-E01]
MKIINRRTIVQEKLDLIKNGYSAYAETFEIANLLKKEIQALNLQVHEDVTDVGSWFIPEKI